MNKNDEFDDRPWVKTEKTEAQLRFEEEAAAEQKKDAGKRQVIFWVVILSALILLAILSYFSEVAWIRSIKA